MWMNFCHATAALTAVELLEGLSFCCAKHGMKGLEKQLLESRLLLLLEFIRHVALQVGLSLLVPAGLCHIQAVGCTALEMKFGVVFF